MGDRTGIEWTDATWNPVVGCSKVSPGCDNCYAITMAHRIEATGNEAYAGTTTQDRLPARTDWTGLVKTLPERLDQPLRWRRPRRVFVNSMSDLFHPDVHHSFIAQVFAVMALSPQHHYQILTKRPQWMAKVLSDADFIENIQWVIDNEHDEALTEAISYGPYPLPNVWLGTSIESDKYTFRANHLRETPAAVRFLSLEPLLGELPSLDLEGIDWVIVGGESGPGARPMHPDWVRDIRDRCVEAGVPFFFKQWGAFRPADAALLTGLPIFHPFDQYDDGQAMVLAGKKAAGRELDGQTWDQMPAVEVTA